MLNKVILYSQKGCAMCSTVKKLLDKKQIDYELVEITIDDVDKYREMGITHTPSLRIRENCLAEGKAIIDWINQQ